MEARSSVKGDEMNIHPKTNKKVIHDLTEYFCSQEPRDIARAFAGTLIDLNRLMNYNFLDREEAACLNERMKHNMQELENFINGERDAFKVKTMNSSTEPAT